MKAAAKRAKRAVPTPTDSIRSITIPTRAISCSRSTRTSARIPVAETADAAQLRLRSDQDKRYDERLRMPKFPFNAEQREQVMTFVLGLTSEPPAEKYIYHPGPREQAIVQGRHVLDKYNCKGCHVLDMERWEFAFDPGLFEEPPEVTDFPFRRSHRDAGRDLRLARAGSPRDAACRHPRPRHPQRRNGQAEPG